MRRRTISLLFLATAALVLPGCLTSQNPFYTRDDVFQDDRILGDYQDPKAEDGFFIRKDGEQNDRYILRYYEGAMQRRWVEVTATLFRAGTNAYMDLFPRNDFSVESAGGVPPSGIDILRNVTHLPLHAVVRAAISGDGLALSLPNNRAFVELIRRHPTYTNYLRDQSVLVLPQSSVELRKLLEIEGETLFPKPTDFKKPKPLEH